MSHAIQQKKKCCCEPPGPCYLLTPCVPVIDHSCIECGNCCFSNELVFEATLDISGLSRNQFCSEDVYDLVDEDAQIAADNVEDSVGALATGDPGQWFFSDSGGATFNFDYHCDTDLWDVWISGGSAEVRIVLEAYGVDAGCCLDEYEFTLTGTEFSVFVVACGVSDEPIWSGTATVTVSLTENRCCKTGSSPACDEQVGEDDCDGGDSTEDCDGSEDSPCPDDLEIVKVVDDLSEYLVGNGGTGVIKAGGFCYEVEEAANCDGAVSLPEGVFESIEELEDCEMCCASD
jgi:hypothetical protein